MTKTTATKLSNRALSALASVQARHFMTSAQWDACLDVLIPGEYINATGTWFLTEKGIAALQA